MDSLMDESLIQEFLTESREHLSSIEPDLLTLEKDGANTDPEIINRVFRAIHSIKGAAGFFGFEALKKLSHVMENLLMQIREHRISPNPAVIEPLLLGVDKLNLMVGDIQNSETVPYMDVAERLETILANGGASDTSAPSTSKTSNNAAQEPQTASTMSGHSNEFYAEPDQLEGCKSRGQSLFALEYHTSDLTQNQQSPFTLMEQLHSFGVVLDCMWETETFGNLETCLEKDGTFQILFASVLEADLLSQALGLPENRIKALTFSMVGSNPQTPPLVTVSAASTNGTMANAAASEGSLKTETAAIGSVMMAPELPETPSQESPRASTPNQPPPMSTDNSSVHEEPKAKVDPQPQRKSPNPGSESMESVRVRVDLLNKLMDLAGEMVLSRNQLLRTVSKDETQGSGLSNIVQNIDLITSELQEHIMQTRMQPIGSVFGKFPRVVRDMARQLNKEIELQMSGEDVELDKSIIESLSDPLTHLIRNCCDHALEPPEERKKAGKPTTGTIILRAFHQDGQINISITDDGRGIDHHKIGQKALKNNLVTEAELNRMSPQEMVNLIFLPGFSTAETISEVSGRGVGMDVVKTNITKLGGHIHTDTEIGKGTTFTLRLPLTLAIIPSLIVGVSNQRFAMPQINLVELVCIRATEIASRIERVGSASVLRLRGKLLPLIRLADILGLERTYTDPASGQPKPDRRREIGDKRKATEHHLLEMLEKRDTNRRRQNSDYNILVLKVGVNQFGLIVDELFDTEEIVVKPLSGYLKQCKCFSGATIMGDGRVAMILDPGGILAYSGVSLEEIDAEKRRLEEAQNNKAANTTKRTLLLFHNALDEIFAVPLSSILRLEKFNMDRIERIGHKEFLTYYGKGLPLIRLEHYLSVNPMPHTQEDAYLIIPKDGNGAAGIIASRIIDTVETDVVLDSSLATDRGIEGSAIVNDHLTLFIEPNGLLERAGISTHGGTHGH